MTEDPTQVPPFGPVVIVTDGIVTGTAGWANAHWVSEQGDPSLILAPDGTAIGDLYDGRAFTRPAPETLPATDATEDIDG